MIKICHNCGQSFETRAHLARYCQAEDCQEARRIYRNRLSIALQRKNYVKKLNPSKCLGYPGHDCTLPARSIWALRCEECEHEHKKLKCREWREDKAKEIKMSAWEADKHKYRAWPCEYCGGPIPKDGPYVKNCGKLACVRAWRERSESVPEEFWGFAPEVDRKIISIPGIRPGNFRRRAAE